MAGWTIRELADRLDLKLQTISGWISAGLVTPDVRRAGRGGYEIGLLGLMELLTVSELRQVGFSTRQIKKAVEYLRARTGAQRPLASLRLVVAGRDIQWLSKEETDEEVVSALQSPGQHVMIFQLGDLHEQLRQQLEGEERDLVISAGR